MEYTKRRNLNRGYMKLESWQRGMDLFGLAFQLSIDVPDFKLRSQFRDASQSVSANDFENFDALHYEVENKLIRLIESLEAKRHTNTWQDTLPSK